VSILMETDTRKGAGGGTSELEKGRTQSGRECMGKVIPKYWKGTIHLTKLMGSV